MAGETVAELDAAAAQLNAAFAKYFVPAQGRDENDLLVCHGNVIRYFVCKALGVDTTAWLTMSVGHCSLTIIQVTPRGAFRVLAVGDMGHIPPPLQSGLTNHDPQLVAPAVETGSARNDAAVPVPDQSLSSAHPATQPGIR